MKNTDTVLNYLNFLIKIRKDNQKTTKDITDKIGVLDDVCKHSETVEELGVVEQEVKMLESRINYSKVLPEIKGMVVYESSSEKARRIIPSLFIGVLILICVFLLVRKI